MVPNETCHMFVPPENSINYMAFPADWSICMSLFLKIPVQSFIPSFSSLYQSASGCRKIFLPLWLLVFQHIHSLPSIFLISSEFSSLNTSFLPFLSFLFYCPLLQLVPSDKGRAETVSNAAGGSLLVLTDKAPCFCSLAYMKQAGIYAPSNND